MSKQTWMMSALTGAFLLVSGGAFADEQTALEDHRQLATMPEKARAIMRTDMRRTMQAHCGVFRFPDLLAEGVTKIREVAERVKTTEIKEIRLRPKTGDYHAAFKVRRARRFLSEGMKVKVRIQFRGREISYPELALEQLREVSEELADIAEVEQMPNMDGRSMLMVMAPKKSL